MGLKLGLATCFLIVLLTERLTGQEVTIDNGWSRNSINTVIFRKNALVSFKDVQFTSFYGPSGFVHVAKRQLNTSQWISRKTRFKGEVADAHRSISIMVDGDGYVHLAWNHHDSELQYVRSTEPMGLGFSAPEPMIGNLEDKVTYPEFYKFPNGDLFFLYRDGSSGKGNLVINRYYSKLQKWERVHKQLIDGEGKRNAYWQACVDPLGTFHLSWVWRESYDVASNHDLCYASTSDYGVTWRRSDGTVYKLPINADSAEYVWRIPENSTLINQTSMAADRLGTPFIATYFKPEGSLVPQYYLIYRNKGTWESIQVTDRTTAFTLGGGGTKKIPISRPQIVVGNHSGEVKIYLIYRDVEHGNRAVLASSVTADFSKWRTDLLTKTSLESWEPTYDTELWKNDGKLHLFVQSVGQGDGESLENMSATPISILEVNTD